MVRDHPQRRARAHVRDERRELRVEQRRNGAAHVVRVEEVDHERRALPPVAREKLPPVVERVRLKKWITLGGNRQLEILRTRRNVGGWK